MSDTAQNIEVCARGSDLPTTPEALLAQLDGLSITYELFHHKAVYTVEEAQEVDSGISGTPCKNLFLRDKKKKMWLVVCPQTRVIDLKALEAKIGANRLSFGSPDRLWQYLGVRPGSVNPFSAINDSAGAVQVILDAEMMDSDLVTYHPMINTMTVSLTPADLTRFLQDAGHSPEVVKLD